AWLDETHSLTRAADPTLVQMARGSLAGGHPPLYFAALRAWIAVFGPSDAAARLLSLVLTLGSLVVLLATLGSRSPPAGLSAGVLFATNPLLVRYGTEIRSYALLILLALVAMAAAWRLADEPGSRSARLALLITIPTAVLTHAAGSFLLPAIVAFVAAAAPRGGRKRVFLALAAPVAAGVASVLVLTAGLALFGGPRQDWWIPPTSSGVAARCFGSLFGLPGWPPEGHPAQFALGVAVSAAAAALIIASRERTALAFLAAAGAFWTSIVLFSLFLLPIVLDRLLLPALPVFFSAIALAAFSRPLWQRRAAGAALLAISTLWALEVRASFGRPIEDFREAAVRIGREYRPGDAILVFPGFASRALQRYLPEEAARVVRRADLGATDPAASVLSLVVRPGLDFRRSGSALALLLDSIASRAPRPRVRILLIEPIDAPMAPEAARYRNEAVSAARMALGEPDEEATNGLLYDARWRAAAGRP
ncbi:MAG: glycosyltransferase family 39 protein, partial [Thermoanaerobaculia bacterium]|nr:glycosyltransferase family 39 protein [Thermoanaerobaculia bacterium]